jgi:hypothetical protein
LAGGSLHDARENRGLVLQQKGADRDGEDEAAVLRSVSAQHPQRYEIHDDSGRRKTEAIAAPPKLSSLRAKLTDRIQSVARRCLHTDGMYACTQPAKELLQNARVH